MRRFVDTNIFLYSVTGHPRFGKVAKKILERIERGEEALTSTLVLCEVSWVLEARGRQDAIKPTLEKIMSYPTLEVAEFTVEDLLVGANHTNSYRIDFNDGVNISVMSRFSISEVYSNDQKHLGRVDFLKLIFK